MSAVLDAFFEPAPAETVEPVVEARTFPSIAVLCAAGRGRTAGAAIALAVARAVGAPCALVAVVGGGGPAAGALAVPPAARRAAIHLRDAGSDVTTRGRLVWLADRHDSAEDPSALCADVGRAAALVGAPAVTVLPLPRTAALDRVIAWHDAVVAVPEPNAHRGLVELGLASIAELGVAVARAEPPSRVAASLALLGLTPPASATAALARLDLAGESFAGGSR